MLNSSTAVAIIVDQLAQYRDVKLIYVNEIDNTVKCTVIRDTSNLVEDRPNCFGIIANFEIAKELLSKSNINLEYEMKTEKEFKEELMDKELPTKEEFDNSEVVYKRKSKKR